MRVSVGYPLSIGSRPHSAKTFVVFLASPARFLALAACMVGCGSADLPRSLPAARGGEVALFAADSPTALLVVTAECAKCRIGVAGYRDVQALVQREGFGFRSVVASGPVAARQFALLLPDAERVALDVDAGIMRALRVNSVPSLVLLDTTLKHRRVLSLEVPSADTAELRREILDFP